MIKIKSKIIQSQTLQNQVYEYLHEKIVNGDIPPGQRIVEGNIAEETGISRSPIREAIRRLGSDGLVSVSPRGGVRVYRATFSDFKYLYECRLGLEPTAAYYAAIRINEAQSTQLADLMYEMDLAVQKKEIDTLKSLSSQVPQHDFRDKWKSIFNENDETINSLLTFYRNDVLNIPRRVEEGANEHQAIWQAIQTQDGKAAEESMKTHIQRDYQFYTSMYSVEKQDKVDYPLKQENWRVD